MNETQAMPSAGTYFATNNGDNGVTSALAASALKANNTSLDEITAYAAMDIKHEIWKAESDVQKAIQVQTNLLNVNNLNLHNRLCESEKAAIEAKYESKLEVKDAVTKIFEKVDKESERTNDKVDTFRSEVKDSFCDLERRLDKQFCEIKERELASEISTLKSSVHSLETSASKDSIIKAVLDAIKK